MFMITTNSGLEDECGDKEIACDEKCVHKAYICNRQPNCDDGSDEANCPSKCHSSNRNTIHHMT